MTQEDNQDNVFDKYEHLTDSTRDGRKPEKEQVYVTTRLCRDEEEEPITEEELEKVWQVLKDIGKAYKHRIIYRAEILAHNRVNIYMDEIGDSMTIGYDRLDRDPVRIGVARNGGLKLCFEMDEKPETVEE